MAKVLLLGIVFASIGVIQAAGPDWSDRASLPPQGHRANIYELTAPEWQKTIEKGRLHALVYPVTVTGALVPYRPLANFLEADSQNPLKKWLTTLVKKKIGIESIQGMYDWMGLPPYPTPDDLGVYQVPYPGGVRPNYSMGVTLMETPQGTGLTFSCAACHSTQLFGKSVLGLTNKVPRANEFFLLGKKYVPLVPHDLFRIGSGATSGETKMYRELRDNLRAIDARAPQVLGLDTSLAQVALSLARRDDDDYATHSPYFERFPRQNRLSKFVVDSKPAVWWNVKYKTRWLSDGSIVSGNPILTNFLWNEIGRGTDLKELEEWMQNNESAIRELTTAVFATKPPRWTDFFGTKGIDLAKAKRGEVIFQNRCTHCHGTYTKAWSLPNAHELSPVERLATVEVRYHEKTPVKDVGTDANRYLGMREFADDLNRLAISKWMKTVVEPQVGYVPPPLEGIWARYPYLHNNSVPTLCDLLSPAALRTKRFYQGPAIDPATDFDEECVGYPVGNRVPAKWKTDDALMNTELSGLSNRGHEKMLYDEAGQLLSPAQRMELIHFLKTL